MAAKARSEAVAANLPNVQQLQANDPQPALDLLAKLRAMLDGQSPIDLAIDDDSQTEMTLQLLRHQLGNDE